MRTRKLQEQEQKQEKAKAKKGNDTIKARRDKKTRQDQDLSAVVHDVGSAGVKAMSLRNKRTIQK
jgi:hypothetical protein